MVSKKEIEEMIDSITSDSKSYVGGVISLGLKKSASNMIRFLRECQMYMETNPSEKYLADYMETSTKIIESIQGGYGQWLRSNPAMMMVRDSKKRFENETGISDLKKRIRTVNFILNGK